MNMLSRRIISIVAGVFVVAGVAFGAGPNGIVSPTGGNPTNSGSPWAAGDTYQLMFVTHDQRSLGNGQEHIGYWNRHVNQVADGSGLAGVADATWYVLGSTVAVDAKDNCVISCPVYLMDGSSLISSTSAEFWDAIIPFAVSIDEHGDTRSTGDYDGTYGNTWTGTVRPGVGSGRELDARGTTTKCSRWNGGSDSWLDNGVDASDTSLRPFFAVSQPLMVQPPGGDTDPPSPTNMSFAVAPRGLTAESVEMYASLAYDVESPPVSYYFENETTGDNSGWQTSASWSNSVTARGHYTYRVKAKDAIGNETAWAESLSSSPVVYGTGYIPAPTGANPTNSGKAWKIGDTYHLMFITSTMTNLLGNHDIDYWNAYVNSVADGSSVTGMSDVTWYVLGSTRDVDARDNVVISAPVFIMNAARPASLFAMNAADFWDSTIPVVDGIEVCADINEHGNVQTHSTYSRCWTGTVRPGVARGNLELDSLGGSASTSRPAAGSDNANWLDNDGTYSHGTDRPFMVVSEAIEIILPPPPSGTVLVIR